MSIRISSMPDEPGGALLPVRDRIDDSLRSHPSVRRATDAVPAMYRDATGGRFGPVRLVERDAELAVVFAAEVTRWVVLVQPEEDSLEASLILGVPNPRITFNRSFRSTYLERLTIHHSADPSAVGEPSELGWLALAGIAAEGVIRFAVRSSIDTDSGDVGDDGMVVAVLRARWKERPSVVVTLGRGKTGSIHHPSLRRE